MKNIIFSCFFATLLSACTSNPPFISQTDYNPKEQSRIRLYGQNGKPTLMRYSLNGQEIKVNVGGGMGDAFSSFVGTAKSQSIGIPFTRISNNVGDQNGILAKAFYKEFAVPSTSALRIQSNLIGMANFSPSGQAVSYSPRCSSKEFSFQPEAGKDYEVASIVNQQGCAVVVFEVQANGEIKPITR